MRRAAGFSLIEMLAVLFVVVVLTGLVTLNVNSGVADRQLQQQVEGLMAVAAYALDEAQFTGTDFGLLFELSDNDRGYRVMTASWRQRLPQGWRPPQQSAEVFKAMEFAESLELSLTLDNITITLQEPNREASTDDGRAPQWLFSTSGETIPGELLLRDTLSGDTMWRLEWDALGRFEAFRGDDVEAYGDDTLATLR